jgi:hypothetical protein
MSTPGQKYARQIRQTLPGEKQGQTLTVDLYDVFDAFPTANRLQHAAKKLLMAGNRGHKDRETDLRDAIYSIERELQAMAATPDDPPPALNSPPFEGEVKGLAAVVRWEFVGEPKHPVYAADGDGWQARIRYNDTLCLWVAYLYHTGTAEAVDDRSFPFSRVGLRDAQEWVARRVSG